MKNAIAQAIREALTPKPKPMPKAPERFRNKPPVEAVATIEKFPLPNYYRWIIDECKKTSKPRTILT